MSNADYLSTKDQATLAANDKSAMREAIAEHLVPDNAPELIQLVTDVCSDTEFKFSNGKKANTINLYREVVNASVDVKSVVEAIMHSMLLRASSSEVCTIQQHLGSVQYMIDGVDMAAKYKLQWLSDVIITWALTPMFTYMAATATENSEDYACVNLTKGLISDQVRAHVASMMGNVPLSSPAVIDASDDSLVLNGNRVKGTPFIPAEALSVISSLPLRVNMDIALTDPIPSAKQNKDAKSKRDFHRLSVQYIKAVMVAEEQGNKFYMLPKVSGVGRIFNPCMLSITQSSVLNSTEMYYGESLTAEGIRAMKLGLISAAEIGLDNAEDEIKLRYFDMHKDNLEAVSDKRKYQLMLQGWNEHLKGNDVHSFVGVDATNSQLQIIACLTDDTELGSYCNVGTKPTDTKRHDFYTTHSKELSDFVGKELDRDTRKETDMPTGYGSVTAAIKAFEDTHLADQYNKAFEALFPAFIGYRDAWLNLWDSTATKVDFKTPLGRRVVMPITKEYSEKIPLLGKGTSFTYKCNLTEATEEGRSLVAHTVQGTDAGLCAETVERAYYSEIRLNSAAKRLEGCEREYSNSVPFISIEDVYECAGDESPEVVDQMLRIIDLCKAHKPYQMISNHDAFYSHPNNCHFTQAHFKELLAQLAATHGLNYMVQQFAEVDYLPPVDPEMPTKIREGSNYCLAF